MKVGILGMGRSIKGVPLTDRSYEWWGLPWSAEAHECDRWFDMHDWGVVTTHMANFPSYLARLKDSMCPIYMQAKHHDIPESKTYPLDRVIGQTGDYFGSSMAYMLALAITEGVDEIGMWGVDLFRKDGFDHERPNMEYLIGFARGRGITVNVNGRSALLTRKLVNDYNGHKVVWPVRYGWV